jgi:hypothetical protein
MGHLFKVQLVLPLSMNIRLSSSCLHSFNTIFKTMPEAASTSEMSINFYQTAWCNIPEDSHLHTRHHESLKSHILDSLYSII